MGRNILLRALSSVLLGLALLVILTLHSASASDQSKVIPAIDVSSPAPGEISVVWTAPSSAPTRTYRLSYGLVSDNDGFTSYKVADSDTGGNAYPAATSTSHTVTGLAAGTYKVHLVARYAGSGAGPWKASSEVNVGDSTGTRTDPPTPTPTPSPTPRPTKVIPRIGAGSPAPGEINVIWTAPSNAPTKTYRLSYGLVSDNDGLTSYKVADSDTGGNAYPAATSTSHTVTGLAAGTYKVHLVARYAGSGAGPWKASSEVSVGGSTGTRSDPAMPPLTSSTTTQPTPEPLQSLQAQDDPCATQPTVSEVSGWASNSGVTVYWKGVGEVGGCRYHYAVHYDLGDGDFQLSAVREAVPGASVAGRQRVHSWGKPETTVVYAVRVGVGCDASGANCDNEMVASSDDRERNFELGYTSQSSSGVTSNARTKGLLLPGPDTSATTTATSTHGQNQNYIRGDIFGVDTGTVHMYRVPMIRGRTYRFTEGGARRDYMEEVNRLTGGDYKYQYLQDEYRITLYTEENGVLTPISGYEEVPELGWQKLPGFVIDTRLEHESDPDYEPIDEKWGVRVRRQSQSLCPAAGVSITKEPWCKPWMPWNSTSSSASTS